ARLLDIGRQISGDSAGRFDYDYDTYVVNSRDIASRYGYGSGYGFYPYHFGYYDPFCYDPFFFSARCYGLGYGFGYPGGFGFGFGFPIFRPYRPYRPYIFTSLPGSRFAQPRLVIPANRPSRYIPIQPRPRDDVGSVFSKPPRDMGRPNIAPRPNSAGVSRDRHRGEREQQQRHHQSVHHRASRAEFLHLSYDRGPIRRRRGLHLFRELHAAHHEGPGETDPHHKGEQRGQAPQAECEARGRLEQRANRPARQSLIQPHPRYERDQREHGHDHRNAALGQCRLQLRPLRTNLGERGQEEEAHEAEHPHPQRTGNDVKKAQHDH